MSFHNECNFSSFFSLSLLASVIKQTCIEASAQQSNTVKNQNGARNVESRNFSQKNNFLWNINFHSHFYFTCFARRTRSFTAARVQCRFFSSFHIYTKDDDTLFPFLFAITIYQRDNGEWREEELIEGD